MRHISLIECSAFFAAMNPNALALLGGRADLAAQPPQVVVLGARQALRAALVDVDLAAPIAQRLLRDPRARQASCGTVLPLLLSRLTTSRRNSGEYGAGLNTRRSQFLSARLRAIV
jgi:hypothetical protein